MFIYELIGSFLFGQSQLLSVSMCQTKLLDCNDASSQRAVLISKHLNIVLMCFLLPGCTCKPVKSKQSFKLFLIKNYLVKVLATAFTIATEIHMGEETA